MRGEAKDLRLWRAGQGWGLLLSGLCPPVLCGQGRSQPSSWLWPHVPGCAPLASAQGKAAAGAPLQSDCGDGRWSCPPGPRPGPHPWLCRPRETTRVCPFRDCLSPVPASLRKRAPPAPQEQGGKGAREQREGWAGCGTGSVGSKAAGVSRGLCQRPCSARPSALRSCGRFRKQDSPSSSTTVSDKFSVRHTLQE